MAAERIEKRQIKSIWGFARELQLDKEDLYGIIGRVTNKESMRALTVSQANKVVQELIRLKDRRDGRKEEPAAKRRTDVGGRSGTQAMRRKIYMLCRVLGWNDNERRLAGFCLRMFGTERVEWLTGKQCHQLIEALKKMVERSNDNGDEKVQEAH